MADIGRIRIRLPANIKQGDVIRVRSSIFHPMEMVQRDKQGTIVSKNYNFVHSVAVTYNGNEIMRAEITQAISQNPIFTFPLKADRPGKLTVAFFDTSGKKHEASAEIKFS